MVRLVRASYRLAVTCRSRWTEGVNSFQVELDAVQAEVELRLQQAPGDVGEEADGALGGDQRPRVNRQADETEPPHEKPRQAVSDRGRSEPMRQCCCMRPSCYHNSEPAERRWLASRIERASLSRERGVVPPKPGGTITARRSTMVGGFSPRDGRPRGAVA